MWMKSLMFQRCEKRGALGTRMVEMVVSNFDEESSELLMSAQASVFNYMIAVNHERVKHDF